MTKPFFYTYKDLVYGSVAMNSNFSNLLRVRHEDCGFYFDNFPNCERGCFTIADLVINSSEGDYTGDIVTLTEKSVRAITYYCVSGTEYAEGGDGSKEHPWASVNYALGQLKKYLDCISNFCNEYIVLKCSGVCDYPIRPILKNNLGEWEDVILYSSKLIISNLIVNVTISEEIKYESVYNLYSFYGVSNINNAIFTDCNIQISCQITWDFPSGGEGWTTIYAFYTGSKFINCSVYIDHVSKCKNNGTVKIIDVFGFTSGGGSEIKSAINCSCNISATGLSYSPECNIVGFGGGNNAIYYNCKSEVIAEAKSETLREYSAAEAFAYGFSYGDDAIYSHCSGIARGTSENKGDSSEVSHSYGFYFCGNVFEKCEGIGEATAELRRAAGFYGSSSDSQFFECTTSDPVCENQDCDEFSPDI